MSNHRLPSYATLNLLDRDQQTNIVMCRSAKCFVLPCISNYFDLRLDREVLTTNFTVLINV